MTFSAFFASFAVNDSPSTRMFDRIGGEGMIKPMRNRSLLLVFLCGLASCQSANAQESGAELFEKKIRPVLVEHCYQCHSHPAGKERGGLLLDTREALRRGGDNGPPLVPGKPADSLLIQSLRHSKADLKMPKNAAK